MECRAKKCVDRCCELANKTTQQLCKVSTPCIDDHHFTEEEVISVVESSQVCSQIVRICLYLARIGRSDILWSVNKFTRSITQRTKARDKRLNRLISYIHHTSEYKQYCHVGNTAKQCRLGLFQDSDFAGDLEDSNSTSGGTLCVFGSHAFVPISWMCKKHTSVSHSSTESEIIFLDAGLTLDGIPALDLWDLIVLVFGNTIQTERPGRPVVNDKIQRSQGITNVLNHIVNMVCLSADQFAENHLENNGVDVKRLKLEGRSGILTWKWILEYPDQLWNYVETRECRQQRLRWKFPQHLHLHLRLKNTYPKCEVKECTRKHLGSRLSGQKSAELPDARRARLLVQGHTPVKARRIKTPGKIAAEQHQRRR